LAIIQAIILFSRSQSGNTNMKLNFKAAIAVPALCAMLATAALAAVTFDVNTGFGFVGKGDVQLAFGWNNKALQTNATA
jgi:hypothetical protein